MGGGLETAPPPSEEAEDEFREREEGGGDLALYRAKIIISQLQFFGSGSGLWIQEANK
jgi:hypothetical protein